MLRSRFIALKIFGQKKPRMKPVKFLVSAIVSTSFIASQGAISAPFTVSQEISASSFKDNTPDQPMCEVIYEAGRVTTGKFDGEEVPVLIYSWAKGNCIYLS
jgi:hypothetical protein